MSPGDANVEARVETLLRFDNEARRATALSQALFVIEQVAVGISLLFWSLLALTVWWTGRGWLALGIAIVAALLLWAVHRLRSLLHCWLVGHPPRTFVLRHPFVLGVILLAWVTFIVLGTMAPMGSWALLGGFVAPVVMPVLVERLVWLGALSRAERGESANARAFAERFRLPTVRGLALAMSVSDAEALRRELEALTVYQRGGPIVGWLWAHLCRLEHDEGEARTWALATVRVHGPPRGWVREVLRLPTNRSLWELLD